MTAAPRHVVTAVVSSTTDATVALVRRSQRVGSYRGAWGALSGFLEPGDATTAARAVAEAGEEAGLAGLTHRCAGRPFVADGRFVVHPHAFTVAGAKPALVTNWESDAAAWVARDAVGRPPYAPTVPRLADAIARVSPSPSLAAAVAAIEQDRARGAAQLAVAALEGLREEAEMREKEDGGDAASAIDAAADAAFILASSRPAMWPLAAALADALAAARDERPATSGAAWRAVAAAATAVMNRLTADAAALTATSVVAIKRALADAPPGARVVTNSYSSAVVAALTRAAADAVAADAPPLPVLVCESRPLNEGVRLARAIADAGGDVQLCSDAAV